MSNKFLIGFVVIVMVLSYVMISFSGNVREESTFDKYNRLEKEYSEQHKPIKEMSSFVGTSGTMSGGFLLIAGSVYGTIDTQHYITLIYQVNINNETFHKSATIPLDNVDFITINKNESSYLTIKSYVSDNGWTAQKSDGTPLYDTWKLKKIRLYLPEGWQIIENKK